MSWGDLSHQPRASGVVVAATPREPAFGPRRPMPPGNMTISLTDPFMKCKEGNCARAQVSGTHVWLCPKAFTEECGPFTCTMLHEITHLGGVNEAQARRFEACDAQWGKCGQSGGVK